jgi:hypothetical protein
MRWWWRAPRNSEGRGGGMGGELERGGRVVKEADDSWKIEMRER